MSGKLMYMQIEQEIRERIRSGVYAPESELPTETELGREFGVSRLTVSKSLANLVKENLISRTRGRGSFVNARRREAPGEGGPVPAGFRGRDESGMGQFPADRDYCGVELFRAQIFFIPAEAGA